MQNNQAISLDEMAKEECRRYYREWRQNNKDKVKQYNTDRWLRKAEKRLQEQTQTKAVSKEEAYKAVIAFGFDEAKKIIEDYIKEK